VSGSSLQIDGHSTIQDVFNDDDTSPLIAIDASTASITDSDFLRLKSQRVSPIFNFQEATLSSARVRFHDFDKTLFSLDSGSYMFDGITVSKGRMAWMTELDAFMVNSIVFDVAAADLSLLNS
jgi:hypothetical protein